MFSWNKWIIECNIAFTFVDYNITRSNTNLAPVCRRTLTKYVDKLVPTVENVIPNELPNKFGIILAGWTLDSDHYIATFASYEKHGKHNCPLLSFSPLLDEECLSAPSHRDFINCTIKIFKRSTKDLLFLVCDNENTNRALSDLLDVPMIGCVSHRFNLAVKNYLKDYEITLQKIHELMKNLKILKKAAYLRRFTTLVPITRNKTRWSSTFDMLKRFFEIKRFIDRSDDDLYSLLRIANEEVLLEKLLVDLAHLDSITKEL